MKKATTKSRGTGDKLYGMPLEDILTPEQLADIKKQRIETERKRLSGRRKRKKKAPLYIRIYQWAKSVFAVENYKRIATVLVGVLLLFVVLNFFAPYIAPKSYISEAMEKTFFRVEKETGKMAERIFGFDIFDEKNIDVAAKGAVLSDSYEKLPGVSAEFDLGISKAQKEAVADIDISKNGESVIFATGYVTDGELGINFPRFFGEYWVSPTSDFGARWNGSGLKKALYANDIDEKSDMSFSNIFCENDLFEESTEKQIKKLLNGLEDSSKAKYIGRKPISVNGKDVNAKTFRLSFNPEKAQEHIIGLCDAVLKDKMMEKRFDVSVYDKMLETVQTLSLRLSNSISFDKNVNLYFFEYRDIIVAVEAEAEYIENLHESEFFASVRLGDTRNIVNSISATVNVSDVNGEYKFDLSSSGNHSGKTKMFSDITTVNVVSNGYEKKLYSEVRLDFKNGKADGSVTRQEGDFGYHAQYFGTLKKDRGLFLDSGIVKVNTIEPDGQRSITADISASILKNRKGKKYNAGSRRHVLDMEKEEADAYLKRITDADVFKSAYKTMEDTFGK